MPTGRAAADLLLRGSGLPRLTLRQLQRLLGSGVLSSERLCSYCAALAHAGETEWQLHAYQHLVSMDEVMDQARRSDHRRRNSDEAMLSVLDGIPVSLKANLAVASQPLTAGSRILGAGTRTKELVSPLTAPPAAVGYDATVTSALLEHCGAVLMGITTMDEFGMGSLGTHVVDSASANANSGSGSSGGNRQQPTKNPLPFLQRLQAEGGGRTTYTDQQVLEILNLPAEAILEAHHRVVTAAAADTYADGDAGDDCFYSAGGSSCGSAASVSHGSSVVSLGSDTGGSVRLPAAWCGVTGLKPTYGLLSRHGLVPYASSLDTVGILAPSADCVQLALQELLDKQALVEPTPRDSNRCSPPPLSFFSPPTQATDDDPSPLTGLTIGIPEAFSVAECPPSLRRAWSRTAQDLQRLGATVDTVPADLLSPAVVQRSLAAYYVLASGEASSNLARYDGFRYGVAAAFDNDDADGSGTTGDWTVLERRYAAARTRGMGMEVSRRVLCGTAVLSADRFHTYYEAAARLRARLTRQLFRTLDRYDALLVPTAVFPPARLTAAQSSNNNNIDGVESEVDATEMFANDVMTVPVSLAGLPALSIPRPSTSDETSTPFQPGLQLVGARLGEPILLRVAKALEEQQQQQQARRREC